ncbi:MAG: hypothetical protein ABIA47_00955 [bacterium]
MALSWEKIKEKICEIPKEVTNFYGVSISQSIEDINYLSSFMVNGPAHTLKTIKINNGTDLVQSIQCSIPHWHRIASYFKLIESIPGSKKLKDQFHHDSGFAAQLDATVYLIKAGLSVNAIEDGDDEDIDVAISLEGESVRVHIKKIDQLNKWGYASRLRNQIFLSAVMDPIKNEDGHRLMLKDFDGSLGRDLTEDELKSIFDELKNSHVINRELPRVTESGDVVIDSIRLVFHWNSTKGTISGHDEFWNFKTHLEKVESKIQRSKYRKHVFIGVTRGMTHINICEQGLENSVISAMFFLHNPEGPKGSVNIFRTQIFGKSSESQLVHELRNRLPDKLCI